MNPVNRNNENFFTLLFEVLTNLFTPYSKTKQTEYLKTKLWDALTVKRIATLHPKVRAKAIEFIKKAQDEGIKLRVFSAYRTYPEQTAIYAKGRTKPGKKITNAKAGQSFHNFALALDVVEIKNGKALWTNRNWQRIGQLGKSVGFEWGGDFKSFKDRPHFQMPFKNTLAELRTKYKNKSSKYVNLA